MRGGGLRKSIQRFDKEGGLRKFTSYCRGVIVNLPLKEGGSTKKFCILTHFDPSPPSDIKWTFPYGVITRILSQSEFWPNPKSKSNIGGRGSKMPYCGVALTYTQLGSFLIVGWQTFKNWISHSCLTHNQAETMGKHDVSLIWYRKWTTSMFKSHTLKVATWVTHNIDSIYVCEQPVAVLYELSLIAAIVQQKPSISYLSMTVMSLCGLNNMSYSW